MNLHQVEKFIPIDEIERQKPNAPLRATPYQWIDASALPRREWLYGHHLIRGFLSVTVAPGGVGKSSLGIVEALAMTTGRKLLNQEVSKPLKVWLWNLEDPRDELSRRIQAACQHYGIEPSEFEGRLFIDSGKEQELCTAISGTKGALLQQDVIEQITNQIIENQIDVIVIDPFVSSHGVSENDNVAIDMVAKSWARIADRAGCAVSLVHHTRKQSEGEVNADSARGAKALIDAARDVRALNRMTKNEATEADVDYPRRYFRVYSDKVNLAPPADKSNWYYLESVDLPNGDSVGVVTGWKWPDPFDDLTKQHLIDVQKAVSGKHYGKDVRSSNWVGNIIADLIQVDIEEPSEKEKVKSILKTWLKSGSLVSKQVMNESRNKVWIVEVGEWCS